MAVGINNRLSNKLFIEDVPSITEAVKTVILFIVLLHEIFHIQPELQSVHKIVLFLPANPKLMDYTYIPL